MGGHQLPAGGDFSGDDGALYLGQIDAAKPVYELAFVLPQDHAASIFSHIRQLLGYSILSRWLVWRASNGGSFARPVNCSAIVAVATLDVCLVDHGTEFPADCVHYGQGCICT